MGDHRSPWVQQLQHVCQHTSHENWRTRLCAADDQSWLQIQTTIALFSEGFWRTNFRWPCRHTSRAIPDADLRKSRLLTPQSIVKEVPAPNFQIMVANGQLETPKSTVELKFEVGDIEFHEIFIVIKTLTILLILSFNLPSTEQQHPGHETRCLEFPFLFNAIKNYRSQIY